MHPRSRRLLEAWKKSGQTLEGYARSGGLVPQRLHWWKKTLGVGAAAEMGAPKVVEKGQYGASFLAHLAVRKCADHTPICRLEKASSVRAFRSRARR